MPASARGRAGKAGIGFDDDIILLGYAITKNDSTPIRSLGGINEKEITELRCDEGPQDCSLPLDIP